MAQKRSNPSNKSAEKAKGPLTPAPSPTGRGEEESLTFDQAVAQLEAIIEKVESGEIGLEQALSEYERGVKLIRRCRTILSDAEQRIEELAADAGDQSDADDAGDKPSQNDPSGE